MRLRSGTSTGPKGQNSNKTFNTGKGDNLAANNSPSYKTKTGSKSRRKKGDTPLSNNRSAKHELRNGFSDHNTNRSIGHTSGNERSAKSPDEKLM